MGAIVIVKVDTPFDEGVVELMSTAMWSPSPTSLYAPIATFAIVESDMGGELVTKVTDAEVGRVVEEVFQPIVVQIDVHRIVDDGLARRPNFNSGSSA